MSTQNEVPGDAVPRARLSPERLRELMSMTPEELQQRAIELLDLSEEQQAVVHGSAWAKQLMRNEDFKHAVAVMIAARQMYAIGYTELQRQLDAVKKAKELPVLTQDVLVQSAMYTASKPFSEHTFMSGLTGTALPALAAIIDAHSEADEASRRVDMEEADRARRAQPLPFPCRVDVDDAAAQLVRDQSLTLMGHHHACRLFADLVLDCVTASRALRVLWLDDCEEESRAADANVFRLPPSAWRGGANTAEAFARTLARHSAARLVAGHMPVPRAIDLVVCSDLPGLFTSHYRGRSPLAAAGDAHRRVWQWCKGAGAALLCFLPQVVGVDAPDPDLRDVALEQIRSFSRLRPLRLRRVEGDPQALRLLVGAGGFELETSTDRLHQYSKLQLGS